MKDYNKKFREVVLTYIGKCIEVYPVKKEFKKVFFSIRRTLITKEVSEIQMLHNYAMTLKTKTVMSLSEFFDNAKKYREQQKRDHDKEIIKTMEVKKYKPFSMDDLKNL